MEIIKEKTACFTGHRPEKINAVLGYDSPALNMLKSMLYYQVQLAIEEGYEYFISGVARGVDLWAAGYVLDLKKKYPYIKLICAQPFKDHSERFKGKDLWDLSTVLSKADEVVNVSENYSYNCYKLRNYYMVDHSSRVIAVVDDLKSGTGQTINYARQKGAELRILNVGDFALDDSCEKFQNPHIYRFT